MQLDRPGLTPATEGPTVIFSPARVTAAYLCKAPGSADRPGAGRTWDRAEGVRE